MVIIALLGSILSDLQSSNAHLVIIAPMEALLNVRVSRAATKMNMVNGNVKNVQQGFTVMPQYLMLLSVYMVFNSLNRVHRVIIVLMVQQNISLMDVQTVCINLLIVINTSFLNLVEIEAWF